MDATHRRRLVHWSFLAILLLSSLALAPFAATHLDLARDVFIASRILHAEAFPWTGPELAGVIHLGPIWYWLLALLLWIGQGWLATLLLLSLLASLQFPLAYLLGKELQGRRAGVIWATALLLPSWSTFENLLPLHYVFTSSLVLACLLCMIRYWRRPKRKYFLASALALSLAMHAHPTCVGLVWLWVPFAIGAWRTGRCGIADILVALLLGLAPVAPYLIWDSLHGFADIRAGIGYVSGGGLASPMRMPTIFWSATFGGTAYWLAVVAGFSASIVASIIAALCVLCGIGVCGFIAKLHASDRRMGWAVVAFAALTMWFTTSVIRGATPFYMTTPLHVLLIGIMALGLSGSAWALARLARPVVVAASLLLYAVCASAIVRHQLRGSWPFSFFPLYDTTAEATTPQALLLMPAFGMQASGDFLCAHPYASIHGAYARALLYDYAIEMRLDCDRSDVQIGGNDRERGHWLGLSRAMSSRLQRQAEAAVGTVVLFAAEPVAKAPGILIPDSPIYPSYAPTVGALQHARYRTRVPKGKSIAVSNLAFFVPNPIVSVSIDGHDATAAVADAVTTVYANTAPFTADAVIDIASPDMADVDIVVF